MTGTEIIVSGGIAVIVVKESFTLIKEVLAMRKGNGNGNERECSRSVDNKLQEIKMAHEIRGAKNDEVLKTEIHILMETRDTIKGMAENIAVLVDRRKI